MHVLSMFFSFEEFLISPISIPSIFNWISRDILRTHQMRVWPVNSKEADKKGRVHENNKFPVKGDDVVRCLWTRTHLTGDFGRWNNKSRRMH